MTKREYLIKKFEEQQKGYISNFTDFLSNPSIARIDPFEIADGLYYVGDKKVCIHLLDTKDGLILIDSGYLGAAHLLVDSIWRAGFDPKDIKMIIHSHGHTDHYGASDEFCRMYGSTLAISKIDAEFVRQRAKKGNIGGTNHPLAKAPAFDYEIEDGEIIEMGNFKIRCLLTPGHSPGVLSFFFDVTYDGKTYKAGLFGGAGTNALKLPYMCYFNTPLDCPEQMLKSIEKLRKETVNIHLGNHPGNNQTLEKRQRQIDEGGNPFIDNNSWENFLNSIEERTKSIISNNDKLIAEMEQLGIFGKLEQ